RRFLSPTLRPPCRSSCSRSSPPPSSPLFPYTTLFRSSLRGQTVRVLIANSNALSARKDAFVRFMAAYRESDEGILARAQRIRVRDRKSTRLNSSHDQISYAVFCLKKKKNCRIIVD